MINLASCTNSNSPPSCLSFALDIEKPQDFLCNKHSESYPWQNVQIAGMGFVTGIAIHPTQKDLIYVRTDAGGIYRWQEETARWVQLLDGMPGHYSIESMALDARNPMVIYAATGAYTREANGEIIKSLDGGRTWAESNLRTPFGQRVKMGGNEEWRWAGERLAVDPNNSQVIYFGSRFDGLFRSQDSGETWHQVSSFPTQGVAPGGLSFVVFDPKAQQTSAGAVTQTGTIYVGVMGEGVYRSKDGGQIWQLLPNGPPNQENPQQAVVTDDGTLYVTTFTSQNDPGGGVWQYEQDQWTNITPRFGKNYSAVTHDPNNSESLMVAEYPFSPQGLYRTVNGGKTWQSVQLQVDAVPWWPNWHLYTLTGGLAMDPAYPQRVWLTTGFGVMRTENVGAQPSRWRTYMNNLEELVVFTLRSPPVENGALVFSGVADAHGFRHDSLERIPQKSYEKGAFGDTTGLDFSATNPNWIVRVGSFPGEGGREDSQGLGAYSDDNGRTWRPFTDLPVGAANGKVAVSATLQPNGKPIILWAPQGEVYPHRSLDGGQTWKPVNGAPNRTTLQLWFPSQAIAADQVDGDSFYLYKYGEPTGGSFYRSLDGGENWVRTLTGLPDHWIHTVKTLPGTAGDVWLSIQDQPLYRSQDAGQTFVPIAQVQQAHTFAFGKAAPGRTNPTVFVDGIINGVEGLFRSEDATSLSGTAAEATWVKISTDRNRLSNITYLEGDMRMFGRVYVGTGGRGIFYGQPEVEPEPMPK